MTPLKTQAIQIALTGDWNKAIELNQQILMEDPKDADTLNRLAFAQSAVGKIKDAKETYENVLKLDPLNSIAQRGLKRLNTPGSHKAVIPTRLDSTMFLEESGKTKIISLLNTAPAKTLRNLQIGQTVVLSIKRMKIFVLDEQKEYIGVLPGDIGMRLIKFLNGGNKYETYVKSANDNGVVIFMKETKRATRFKNQPTFLFGDKTHLAISKGLLKKSQADASDEDVE